jgi:hypothetical protein
MALVVEITRGANPPVAAAIRSLSITSAQNNQDTLTCELQTQDPTAVEIDDTIEAVLDGTSIFGGTIKTPIVSAFGDSIIERNIEIDAVDYNELAVRQVIFGLIIPAGTTLKAAATLILPYIPGVILDPAWIGNGPTIAEELTFDEMYPEDALKELATRSGWLHNITYDKLLRYFEPGTWTAPWTVTDGDGNTFGRIKTGKTRIDYYNRLIVKFSESARAAYAFLLTTGNFNDGDAVEAGGRTYHFKLVLTGADTEVLIGASAEASLENLIAAIMAAGGGGYDADMTVNGVVGALLQSSAMMKAVALTPGASGNSIACTYTPNGASRASWVTEGGGATSTLTFGFDEGLTGRVHVNDLAEQALYGIYTGIIEAVSTFDIDSARALGTLVLAIKKVTPTAIKYRTRRAGLFPGMTQSFQSTFNGISTPTNCLIVEVSRQIMNEGPMMEHEITLVTGNVYRGPHWRDVYELWRTGGTGTVGATSVGGGGGGGGTTVISKTVYLLQGSSNGVQSPTAGGTWVKAAGSSGGEGGIEYLIDTTVRGNNTGMVYVRLRSDSGNIRARLYGAVAGQVGVSDWVTSTTFTTKSFAVTFATGADTYWLEVELSVADVDGYAVGYLE